MVKCVSCKQLFHGSKDTPWVVNKPLIEWTDIEVDMSRVEEARVAMQNAITSKNPSSCIIQRTMQELESGGHGHNVKKEGGEEEISRSNHSTMIASQNLPAGHHSEFSGSGAISQRSRPIIKSEEYDSDEYSRFSAETDFGNKEPDGENNFEETEGSHSYTDESRNTRKRKSDALSASSMQSSEKHTPDPSGIQPSVVGDEGHHSLKSIDLENDNHEEMWLRQLSRCDMSVYRVRTFLNDSLREHDKFGRKCSFWCIKYGFVATSAILLTALPTKIQQDGEACKHYIRDADYQSLKKTCRHCESYYSWKGQTYTLTFKYFVEMKPGDVVVMQMKGGDGRHNPRPALVFGIIKDDSLILMKKREAMDKYSFPWDFEREGERIREFDDGMMLRRVKWYRHGILRKFRGSAQADWLAESITKWMAKVKGEDNGLCKKAIQKMGSEKFIKSTQAVDYVWIDIGLSGS